MDWGQGETLSVDVPVAHGSFTLTHQYLDDNPTSSPQDTYRIKVTLKDDDTGSDTADLSTTVRNVDPVLTSFQTSATKSSKAVVGDAITVSGSFTDIGSLDSHTVIIDWQDGTTSRSDLTPSDFVSLVDDGASGSYTASHTYSTGGIFTVTVTVLDDDTASISTDTLVWVSGMRIDPHGVLQIVGTNGEDHVSINHRSNGKGVMVHAKTLLDDPFEVFDTSDVANIVAYLCDGDDHLTIAGSVEIPAIIHGDGGNDHLNGGAGEAVLLGDGGDDMIVGGPGPNLLIGGLGADDLVAGSGSDVLVGGSTSEDSNDHTLFSLIAAWNVGAAYPDRIAAVDALWAVDDDGEVDKITGSSGLDLFYDGVGDTLTDVDLALETVL